LKHLDVPHLKILSYNFSFFLQEKQIPTSCSQSSQTKVSMISLYSFLVRFN